MLAPVQEAPPVAPPETEIELPPTADELPSEDGIPLETPWHRDEMTLLIEIIRYHYRERTDFYTGGNMFIYFSLAQVRDRDYRGPDFFVVFGVDGRRERKSWVIWEEGGRYPDVIIELLSSSTAEIDKTVKKRLYEQTFRTPEYYCYDPDTQELLGWHLQNSQYVAQAPDAQGRIWSKVLHLSLGEWEGEFQEQRGIWLRFFDSEGNLIPIEGETAKAERERAAAERIQRQAAEARAEAERVQREAAEARTAVAEDELARLRAELARLKGSA